MEERLDPVQIIALPSDNVTEDQVQALGVWMHYARKAGWHVEGLSDSVDRSAGECGVVEIEGLRYLVRVGPRGRGRAIIAPDEHIGACVADAVLNRRAVTSHSVFVSTVWAEPILS
ncbi:hypothetical protein J7E87_24915 [Streptomyces sp. ISL-1]|uniref:hypothetical protein n=1 Tax=Streptomyces sp. ISL-1 TaxID=2817657 RepID=UPI001BE98C1E|nr:hypothetical protein [Streptomyces sp. ISL-1]MBT2392582.1 hypothetical protein [Streptomyces sp. ISL-1]